MAYLYVIRERNDQYFRFCKIGVSKDVKIRLRRLQIGNPRDLLIEAMIECTCASSAYTLEKIIHSELEPVRVQSEWFRISHLDALRTIHKKLGDLKSDGLWTQQQDFWARGREILRRNQGPVYEIETTTRIPHRTRPQP